MIPGKLSLTLCLGFVACTVQASETWALWENYARGYVEPSGRVIDWSRDGQTRSREQSYSLFFALVANDRKRFQNIYQWSTTHLAPASFSSHRAARLWGRRADQTWGIIDEEPDAGADLWWAYTLLEATRLWNEPEYAKRAERILTEIAECCVVQNRGRPMLIPGLPHTFGGAPEMKASPADIPPALMLRFAQSDPNGPWMALLDSTVEVIRETAPLGRVPDYVPIATSAADYTVPFGLPGGSQSIRVYLWFGMAPLTPITARGIDLLAAFAQVVEGVGHVPATWTNANGGLGGPAPIGYYGALLPFWQATEQFDLFRQATAKLEEENVGGLFGSPAQLSNQTLVVFGQGFVDHKYKFDSKGRTQPAWKKGPRS